MATGAQAADLADRAINAPQAGKSDDQIASDTAGAATTQPDIANSAPPAAQFTPVLQAPTSTVAASLSTPSAPTDAAETVANLSAQIVQQAGGKTSRFDVQMTPEGFGRVDVAVQIDAQGKVTAALSFERPEAAALVKDRAGDLQSALAAAGLDLAPDALKISHTQTDAFAALSDTITQQQQQSVTASASAGNEAQTGGQGSQSGQGQPQHFAAGGQSFQSDSQSGQSQQGQQGRSQAPAFGNLRSFEATASAADIADLRAAYAVNLSARGLDIRI